VPELRAPFTNAAIKAPRMMMRDLTEHKITDRKRGATLHATKKWIANTQKVDRRPSSQFAASPDL